MSISAFLVYINPADPTEGYRVASKDEWNQILNDNRGKPMKKRRLFTRDRIVEGNNKDDLYIESTIAEYKKWFNREKDKREIRECAKAYSFFSMDIPSSKDIPESERVTNYQNVIDFADIAILFDQLVLVLDIWKPWATELLKLRMSEHRNQAAAILSKKHGISQRQYERRIRQLEKYIKYFLENDVVFQQSSPPVTI